MSFKSLCPIIMLMALLCFMWRVVLVIMDCNQMMPIYQYHLFFNTMTHQRCLYNIGLTTQTLVAIIVSIFLYCVYRIEQCIEKYC